MIKKNELINWLYLELNFSKTIKLIFVIFSISFFSLFIIYMYNLLSQLMFPGSIEIWVSLVFLSVMFGFALSSYVTSRDVNKLRCDLDNLKADLADKTNKE